MINNPVLELKGDPRVQITPGPEILAVNGGLQPFSVLTSKGTLLSQVQMPEVPIPSERIRFPHCRIASYVSRDHGASWQGVDQLPGRTGSFSRAPS